MFKPDCKRSKTCTHTAKKDCGPVNSEEFIQNRFDELKKSRQERWVSLDKTLFSGTWHLADGDIGPRDDMTGWGDAFMRTES